MKEELLPILIIISILGVAYLVLRSYNRKKKNQLRNKRFHRNFR